MSYLRYCTEATVEQLRNSVQERIEWYYDSNRRPMPDFLGGFRETTFDAPKLSNKLMFDNTNLPRLDGVNALVVYEALKELSPHQASIEKVWVYLCHYDCPDYVAKRWLLKRNNKEVTRKKRVLDHFFVSNNTRAVIRDNGVSRLWWLGKIAHDVDPESPERFLDILLYRQAVRGDLLERPFLSRNLKLLSAIYVVLRDHWETEDKMLFKRTCFRNYLQSLNRRGGVVLLDSLSESELLKLLREEAETAIR